MAYKRLPNACSNTPETRQREWRDLARSIMFIATCMQVMKRKISNSSLHVAGFESHSIIRSLIFQHMVNLCKISFQHIVQFDIDNRMECITKFERNYHMAGFES